MLYTVPGTEILLLDVKFHSVWSRITPNGINTHYPLQEVDYGQTHLYIYSVFYEIES